MSAFGTPFGSFEATPTAAPTTQADSGEIWRPPQWNKPAPYLITLTQDNPSGGEAIVTNYYFDAVLRSRHHTELRKTEQPTQIGANSVDHSYMLPAKLVLEIGMSDAMDRYAPDNYTSNSSKSVSAYQTLVDLQTMRVPLTVTTRLTTFQNMLIDSISTEESSRTSNGLRAVIQFSELLTGQISAEIISSRPQQTDDNPQGTVTPDTDTQQLAPYLHTNLVQQAQQANAGTHNNSSQLIPNPKCPGAGGYSSYTTPQLYDRRTRQPIPVPQN